MRRRWNGCEMTRVVLIFILLAISASSCDGARRAQRRKDTARAELPSAVPSAETLTALAQAMGAAGFEHREGRTLVKRLIPADSQPDLDLVEHQGVIGKAGVDFPAYPSIPNTGFNCKNVLTGYYADLETDCQVFHICDTSRKISFLCPNGTIFSQSHLICDWWFKVDCASAPALYESSAEYYSNEQKKSQKITQSLSKNIDYQQIADNNARESRRSSVNVPSTTERLLRHRQRLQTEAPKATARSFHAYFAEVSPTLNTKTETTTNIDKKRRNLVQLIANNFGNLPARTTLPTYTESSTYRSDKAAGDYNSLKEMQVAAETASFTNNKNRQYLQDAYNKNYRPYPVYMPNLPNHQPLKVTKPKTNPTLTTLYDFRDRTLNQVTKEVTMTTKRPTLLPYTKSYATTFNDRREPYTRPGISSLKEFLEKERNKTLSASTTEKIAQVTDRSDHFTPNVDKKVIESKNNFESVTKIPQTTRNQYYGETASDRISTPNFNQITTEPSYQERRERLMRKLNLETFKPTEATVPTTLTEKYYGDLPNRPGLLVPPSLTPKTLHTLAIYYATALDNLSTTTPPEEASEASTPTFDDYGAMEDALPALFSQHTINKYSKLFGHGTETSELLEEIKLDPNGTYNELADDLAVQQSQNPLATSPQIRELAQVFTHALSAYLQDPIQFRKVLSDIRPTHPSFGDMLSTTEESYNTEPTTTVNEDDDEILGFSDDNKIRSPFVSLRDGKALNIATDYPTVSDDVVTTPSTISTDFISTTAQPTTPRSPFRCCGRISASYTTASTPIARNTTPFSFTNTVAANVNTLANNNTDFIVDTTTEDNYLGQRYGGFQNNSNSSPYGKEVLQNNAKPLTEYVEVTNLPSAWGVDVSDATSPPITDSDNIFESKKIRSTTGIPDTTPVYFTEADSSIELENEEELQRAHSQSFVTPQNNLRQGKQINLEESKTTVKKPSEELEAPTISEISTATVQSTTQPSTTVKEEESVYTVTPTSDAFTSPESDKTSDFSWPTTFEYWQSTVIDPITLNDGLSPSAPKQGVSQLAKQTNAWAQNTFTTPVPESKTNEQSVSSSVFYESTTPRIIKEERAGKLIKDPTSTESAQDITTIADTVVEKAKEIMGGMNATTTEKLMNVMKKTKSKTVRRLILLLVQTCDDDHNTTAEASKKALLEALMAVSQKDMDEITKEEEGVEDLPTTVTDIEVKNYKRSDKIAALEEIRPKQFERRGKSINYDPSAINSLSSPSTTTTENIKTTTEIYTETTQAPRTTTASRRGIKKFLVRTTPVEQKTTKTPDNPIAEARVAPPNEPKTPADTRALELLRSLYTIAARWG